MEETKQISGSEEENQPQQNVERGNWPLLFFTLGFLSVAEPLVHGAKVFCEGARSWYLFFRQFGKN